MKKFLRTFVVNDQIIHRYYTVRSQAEWTIPDSEIVPYLMETKNVEVVKITEDHFLKVRMLWKLFGDRIQFLKQSWTDEDREQFFNVMHSLAHNVYDVHLKWIFEILENGLEEIR